MPINTIAKLTDVLQHMPFDYHMRESESAFVVYAVGQEQVTMLWHLSMIIDASLDASIKGKGTTMYVPVAAPVKKSIGWLDVEPTSPAATTNRIVNQVVAGLGTRSVSVVGKPADPVLVKPVAKDKFDEVVILVHFGSKFSDGWCVQGLDEKDSVEYQMHVLGRHPNGYGGSCSPVAPAWASFAAKSWQGKPNILYITCSNSSD